MHLAIGAASVAGEPGPATPDKIERAVKLDARVSESFSQGIADLAEMAPCHHFAEQALNILRYLAKKWNIDVDIDGSKTPPDDYDILVKPYTGSLNFFAPNIEHSDFICDWGTRPEADVLGTGEPAQTRQAGDAMDNPLFWPFPMQGRPILLSGKELEAAGFAVI
jgi:hypothetical protein